MIVTTMTEKITKVKLGVAGDDLEYDSRKQVVTVEQ
jgi:hypothetical protein